MGVKAKRRKTRPTFSAGSSKRGPDCDPCGGSLEVIVQSKKRTDVLVSYKISIKWVRELCVVSHSVFLNLLILYERGARVRQIGLIDLRPALPTLSVRAVVAV